MAQKLCLEANISSDTLLIHTFILVCHSIPLIFVWIVFRTVDCLIVSACDAIRFSDILTLFAIV